MDWKADGEQVVMVPVTKGLLVAIFSVTVCAIGDKNKMGMTMADCPDEFLEKIEAWLNHVDDTNPELVG